ncbi:hypothetical protein A3K63_01705, partial [Candidatus Micrarchaeota archaeon RBG_16_49_10]
MVVMDDGELMSRLHEHERKILKVLEKKKMSMNELRSAVNLPRDSVEKASLWAKVKGVLQIDEKVLEFCEITEEGKEYTKKGLPEKGMLKLISKGDNRMDDLKGKMEGFPIALVWVKKNGWAEIREGRLEITEKGKEALKKTLPEEKALQELVKGPKLLGRFDENLISTLERRNLVKRVEEKEKTLYLTDLGKSIAPKLKTREEIGQLTPQIIIGKEWKKKPLRAYDITLPTEKIYPGRKHVLTQVIEYIRKVWLEMGFKEMAGPTVDVSFWNFDALYQPQDHPARDLADTFYMKVPKFGKLPDERIVEQVKATHENGWTCNSTGWQYDWDLEFSKRCILRTHTTNLSAHTIASLTEDDLPAKFFS